MGGEREGGRCMGEEEGGREGGREEGRQEGGREEGISFSKEVLYKIFARFHCCFHINSIKVMTS